MTYHRDRPDAPQPACAGKWELFESTETDQHIEARALCYGCPMRGGCLDEAERVASLNRQQFGRSHLVGTWGGQLFGRVGHNPARVLRATPKPYPAIGVPEECGGCGSPMVARGVEDESAVKYAARGLCETCYQRARTADRKACA